MDRERASSRDKPLGVAEVVRLVGRAVDQLGLVWIEGEITQINRPPSGHVYFQIRDRDCALPAILWSRDAQRLRGSFEVGVRVRVRGRLGVYDRDGKLQLYADFVEPAGAGADAAAREALKAKLAAEGLFAPERKRALPRFPRRIGVVTSRTGAAIHDILRTVERRFPTPILICDAAVQGPTAPAQLVNAMAAVVRAGVDVLIVGRGGGAAIDLAAFDHERVVRTIARCPVPVISAVGHEVDLSLADLAADARASTPTAAAELCVPDRAALADGLRREHGRLDREIHHALSRAHQDLDRATMALHGRGDRALATMRAQVGDLERKLAALHPRARISTWRAQLAELERRIAASSPAPRIARGRADCDALATRAQVAIGRRLDERRGELARLAAQAHALSPLAVLDRGYSVAMLGDRVIRDVAQAPAGARLRLRLANGELTAVVERAGEPEAPDAPEAPEAPDA